MKSETENSSDKVGVHRGNRYGRRVSVNIFLTLAMLTKSVKQDLCSSDVKQVRRITESYHVTFFGQHGNLNQAVILSIIKSSLLGWNIS